METFSLVALYGFSAIALAVSGIRLANGNALWKLSIPRIGWIDNTHCLDAVFLLSGIAFIWIARLPILQFALALDPDEAQFSANAMRIWAGGMNWDNLDSTSSGPLNSAVLAWPYLMGLDVTLATTRIMGTAIVCIMLIMLFLGIRHISSTETAVLSSYPLFIFYATISHTQIAHYNSQNLSLMLLSVGVYGYLRIIGDQPVEKGRSSILLLSGFSLGLIPFAKLQAAPLAVLVGLALIAAIFCLPGREKWKQVTLVSCGAIVPSLMFLLPLLVRGEFHHFIKSYLLYAVYYVDKPLSMEGFFRFARSNAFFWDVCCSYAAIFGISLVFCFFFQNSIAAAKKWAVGLAALSIPVAWFCIVLSGREFLHYLLLLLPSLALFAGAFNAIGSDAFLVRMRSVRLQRAIHIVVSLAVMAALIPAGIVENQNNPGYRNGEFRDGLTFKSPRLMQWLETKKSDSLLVWGWMPQWYLSTGMTPATRETQNYIQIDSHFPKDYYRERLIQDFNKSHPDFVLDAVAPNSFYYSDPDTQSISSFPALAEIIRNSFIRVSPDDPYGYFPRLYVRKERLVEILKKMVLISGISASGQYSGAVVNDGNVFEFSIYRLFSGYAGFWLAPEGSTGYINVEFPNSKVGSVSILNTRSDGFHASERVRILVLLGETVLHQHELILNRYPYWTNYKLPEPVASADSVRIEILSYIGKGAGLNEIKIYREQPEGMG